MAWEARSGLKRELKMLNATEYSQAKWPGKPVRV